MFKYNISNENINIYSSTNILIDCLSVNSQFDLLNNENDVVHIRITILSNNLFSIV